MGDVEVDAVDSSAGSRTVYVGNLAWSVGWQDLKDKMSEAGEVAHVEVLTYRNGKKTGSAIVTFTDEDGAKAAIKDLNDAMLNGRPIFLREDREGGKGPGSTKGKGKGPISTIANRQVFVGNLVWNLHWRDLKDLMSEAGEVEHCDFIMDSEGRPSGSGLVRFKDAESAKRAVEELTNRDLFGRNIFVREDREGREIDDCVGKGKGKKGKKGKGKGKGGGKSAEHAVYCGNIDPELSWTDLKDLFQDYGVTHADVGELRGGKNRGFGILKFASYDDAVTAIKEMDKHELDNGYVMRLRWDDKA